VRYFLEITPNREMRLSHGTFELIRIAEKYLTEVLKPMKLPEPSNCIKFHLIESRTVSVSVVYRKNLELVYNALVMTAIAVTASRRRLLPGQYPYLTRLMELPGYTFVYRSLVTSVTTGSHRYVGIASV
jgi:hypothetical protein